MIYTGSGNVPYVQCGSVGDFIPEARCSKSVVGYKQEGERWGVREARSGPTGRAEGDRNSAMN